MPNPKSRKIFPQTQSVLCPSLTMLNRLGGYPYTFGFRHICLPLVHDVDYYFWVRSSDALLANVWSIGYRSRSSVVSDRCVVDSKGIPFRISQDALIPTVVGFKRRFYEGSTELHRVAAACVNFFSTGSCEGHEDIVRLRVRVRQRQEFVGFGAAKAQAATVRVIASENFRAALCDFPKFEKFLVIGRET